MPLETRPRTLGGLRKSGYKLLSVREEMRKNLIGKLRRREGLFPGIIGYEDTVFPQVENAILAGQDIIFLGERGQAKSRLIRSLVSLLDEYVPYIAGCEIVDDPFNPICKVCRLKLEEAGDEVEVAWVSRDNRYGEKLATPDVSVADLIGEIDPIRVAEGRYLSDEMVIHYGLIPRTNRGIFCINELPDLAERIQVSLFNLMEERDVQIKGYLVRLPLDVYVVASANPEDYTNRGRIITPLKDRYGAQIRTHYPKTLDHETQIMEQERSRFPDAEELLVVPKYIKDIIADISSLARRSPDINQRSGVSVRVSISNYEAIRASALRRAILNDETKESPRITDFPAIYASTAGKIELETIEEGRETRIVEELIKKAVLNVFGRYFSPRDFDALVQRFEEGLTVETSPDMPAKGYMAILSQMPQMAEAISKVVEGKEPALIASWMEFILEGLHLNRRLNRDKLEGRSRYRG